jgi:hypothetical protein
VGAWGSPLSPRGRVACLTVHVVYRLSDVLEPCQPYTIYDTMSRIIVTRFLDLSMESLDLYVCSARLDTTEGGTRRDDNLQAWMAEAVRSRIGKVICPLLFLLFCLPLDGQGHSSPQRYSQLFLI